MAAADCDRKKLCYNAAQPVLCTSNGLERRLEMKMDLHERIRHLLTTQRLAVLATQAGEQPYASLVTLAASPDLRWVLFPTLRASRKFANMEACPSVALLVDNRSNLASDLSKGIALTVLGTAREVTGDERQALSEMYLAKHPQLQTFLDDPDCALVRVQVARYVLVSNFQEKAELRMADPN
jgi:hypothetical protein